MWKLQAAPATKALEDDITAARQQAVGLDIETLEYANALNILDLRTDIEVQPISDEIISQLRNLDVRNIFNLLKIEAQALNILAVYGFV